MSPAKTAVAGVLLLAVLMPASALADQTERQALEGLQNELASIEQAIALLLAAKPAEPVISGTPTAAGSYAIGVRVTDANGVRAAKSLTIIIR